MKNKIIFIMVCALLIRPVCCQAQKDDIITKKTTSILSNLLNSKDSAQFSKTHGIELKNGLIIVIITVDANLLPKDFVSKYDLKEFKIRNNTVSAYVKLDMLKKMCEEPGVIFIRTPFKFRALSK